MIFNVELLPTPTLVGLKLAPTPEGNVLAMVNAMLPVNPFSALVFTV